MVNDEQIITKASKQYAYLMRQPFVNSMDIRLQSKNTDTVMDELHLTMAHTNHQNLHILNLLLRCLAT